MLEILSDASAYNDHQFQPEPEMLIRSLESVIAYIKNGVQVIRYGIPDFPKKKLSAEASPEKMMYELITVVIHEVFPSVLILPESEKVKEDKVIIAQLNRLRHSSKQV